MEFQMEWVGSKGIGDWFDELRVHGLPRMLSIEPPVAVGDVGYCAGVRVKIIRPATIEENAACQLIADPPLPWPRWVVSTPDVDSQARKLIESATPTPEPCELEVVYNRTLAAISTKVTRYIARHGEQPGEIIAAHAIAVACSDMAAGLGPMRMVEYSAEQVAKYFEALDKQAQGQPLSRVEVIQAFGDLVQMQRAASLLSAAEVAAIAMEGRSNA